MVIEEMGILFQPYRIMKKITFFALLPVLTCLAQDLPVDKSVPIKAEVEEVDNRDHTLALASVIPGKVVHTDPIPEPEEDDDVVDNRDPNLPLANLVQVNSPEPVAQKPSQSSADFDFTADIASAAKRAATSGIAAGKFSATEVASKRNIEDLPDATLWPMDEEPPFTANGSVLNQPTTIAEPVKLNPAPVFQPVPFTQSDFVAQPILNSQPAYTPEQPLTIVPETTSQFNAPPQAIPPVYQNTLDTPTGISRFAEPVKKKLGAKRIPAPKFTRAYSLRLNSPAVSRRVSISPTKRMGTLAELYSATP